MGIGAAGSTLGAFALKSSYSQGLEGIKITSHERPDELPDGVNENSYNSTEQEDIARRLRERLINNPYRPGYHFVIPEGIALPFDPNGAIFWKGRYHLFYIFQDSRTGKGDHNWGHVSSTDLFHWRHHPTTLIGGMFSGNCFINMDGIPTICHHKVGKGNSILVALDDDLNYWKYLEKNPITPSTKPGDKYYGRYRSWDPFGFVDNGMYYAIFGGKRPAIAKCKTLDGDWKYVGDLLSHRNTKGIRKDEDVSCADMFKLGNKHVLLCISHRLGCRYYIGDWKNEQFHPESHQQMSWNDRSFFAPRSLEDANGRRIMWAWVADLPDELARRDLGWSGTWSLPRVLTMTKDNKLMMDVPEEIKNLRYNPRTKKNITIPADTSVKLDDINGNSIELAIEMDSKNAKQFGVKVCVSKDESEQTVVYYDAENKKLSIDTNRSSLSSENKAIESGPFELEKGESLKLRVFVDKSIIEVFANARQAVVRRLYPTLKDSLGVKLFAKGAGAKVNKLNAWDIMPSNPY